MIRRLAVDLLAAVLLVVLYLIVLTGGDILRGWR
jgi:hypothetical protein